MDSSSYIIAAILIWVISRFILSLIRSKNDIPKIENSKSIIKIILVNIEKHGSVFFFYEKATNMFVAQGLNIEELRQNCSIRFKDTVIVADSAMLKEHGLE